ncbi:MAG: phage tail protein [Bryobacteraceae bacterium]
MGGSSPYVGMLLLVPYNFAPASWMFCAGQSLAISENDTLFNLIGTTFGGDGQSTFNLPDLRGRTPVHQGPGYVIGQRGGVENVTLTGNQLPSHTHSVSASSGAQNSSVPSNNVLASGPLTYVPNGQTNGAMAPASIASNGGSQPHANLQPYLTLNWIISLFGIYPSQG